MTANEIYKKALENGVFLEAICSNITADEWENLFKNSTRANKKKVEKIIKFHFPEGWFKLRNPYDYFKTKTHIIYVHSATDYFFKIIDQKNVYN